MDSEPHEEWRPVLGLEGVFEVSSLGRVRRSAPARGTVNGRMIWGKFDRHGYRRVNLQHNRTIRTVHIHRLVAESFLGARPDGYVVNHIDGIKTNNTVGNLEWVTPVENHRHAIRSGLVPDQHGEANRNARLTNEQVREIRSLRGVVTQAELGRRFGVSKNAISMIQLGRQWVHLEPAP